jgi:hypothetical protein
MISGEYLGYVWNLTKVAAAYTDNIDATAVPKVVLEAKATP